MALTSSPESAHTLQFEAKYHMFSYLVDIKIYVVVHVTWSVSESVPLPLRSPPQQVTRKDPVLKYLTVTGICHLITISFQNVYYTYLPFLSRPIGI